PRRRGRPARECWETSTARTARSLPPWTGKRVPLVSRAPKIVLPRRLNKHGTRQDEVRQPAQLPRRAHRAAATRDGAGGADAVPDSRARDARPARRGGGDRGVPPLHDDARRREAKFQDGHERPAGRAPPGREDPGRIPAAGARRPGPGVSDAAPAAPAALAGKLALVTGASRGIGLAVAEVLHAARAHVVRLARSLVDATADGRTDLRCDVTDPAAVERVVGRVLADRGVPDIVVNNAGIFFVKPVAETTPHEFSRTIAVNLVAPFLLARALVPHLVRRGTGHLVTIGSISD